MPTLTSILLCALLAALSASPATASVAFDAGDGAALRIEDDPFRLVLTDRTGREVVSTLAGPDTVPGSAGADGPEPLVTFGGYPAIGWIVGARGGGTIPVFLWAGNRLFGAEAGGLISVTGVRAVRGTEIDLDTTAGSPATMSVRRLPGGGVRVTVEPPADVRAVASMFTLASPPSEGLYGLGARKDAFDQRGRLRNVWVEQQNAGDERAEPVTGPDYTFPNGAQAAYYVQSALFGSRGWGAWTASTALQRVDLAASRDDAVRWGVADPVIDVTLAGGTLEAASRAWTAATGRAPAPPRHVYEPWIDVINEGEGEAAPNGHGFAGGERVRTDLLEIAAKRRELDLPIGVVGIEGWHAIPGSEELFGELRGDGLRLAGYWNPFLAPGTPAHREAAERDLLVEDGTGRPYPVLTSRNTIVNVVDFSHPGAAGFWRGQLARSARMGLESFMHDFGEFVTEGMSFHDGTPPELMHNRYPVLYHRAARDALAELPGEPWFYVRSGFNGTTGDTSGVFPGDETTDWAESSGIPSVIPAMLNLALGGAFTFTTDVGGYFDFVAPRTTPELLTRWTQLAAFTPVLRLHNSTSKRSLMPWDAGPEALAIFRRYARAKVRLIPLVDRLSRRAARSGAVGPVRPMVLEDPALKSVDDQWLLGRRLLVAPVLRRGATRRPVALPAGAFWERVTVGSDGALVPTGDMQAGGRTIIAPAPLADIPVFTRARRRCRARPRFDISIRSRRRPTVTLDGKRLPLRRAGRRRWRAKVDLRSRSRRAAVVRIRVGSRPVPSRVYATCRAPTRRP